MHMQRCILGHALFLGSVHALATRYARPLRVYPCHRMPARLWITLLARCRRQRPRLQLWKLWIWHCVGVQCVCALLPVPVPFEVTL